MKSITIKIDKAKAKKLNSFLANSYMQKENKVFPAFSIERKFQDGYSAKLELVNGQKPYILVELIDEKGEIIAWTEDTELTGKHQFDTCKFEEEATIYCEKNHIEWNDFEKTDKYKELSKKYSGFDYEVNVETESSPH